MLLSYALLFLASLWAGTQNALAGGGSFVTFPALLLAGLDIRAANVTSTVALFPGQVISGVANRKLASGTPALSLGALCLASLLGGGVGAVLLLLTPVSFFARLVPWLVLFATGVFAWGSFGRKPDAEPRAMSPALTAAIQFAVAIYGGYFGGGIGFLMLAVLTVAGVAVRTASASKNLLAGVINAGAVLIFALSPDVGWAQAAVVCAGSVVGGLLGAWLLPRTPERALRMGIVGVGLVLTVGLFLRTP